MDDRVAQDTAGQQTVEPVEPVAPPAQGSGGDREPGVVAAGVEPAIEVEGVGKRFRLFSDRRTNLKEVLTQRRRKTRYEEFWAVRDITLTIPRGSTFGLVGHNGSGKSTLLKMIAGIHRPTLGTITKHGRVTALLELGAGFHPELSGRENIYLNGAILGMSRKRIDERIEEIIEFSGIGQFIDVPVKVYSSGMYVRLGFAIAVTLDPEILVIDEIIAVGDEEFQRRCFDYLHRLRKRGVTIIFVTHSMGLVQQMCDGAAWLDGGRLRVVGTADEVVNAYLDTVNAAETERLTEEQAGATATTTTGVHDRGTGEVVVDRLELIDRFGQTRTTALAGDPLTVRVHYDVRGPVERAVIGLGIRAENGVEIAGPNTRTSGLDPVALTPGPGSVDYVIDPLILNPGTYYLSAALVDETAMHVYDYWYEAAQLVVQPGHGQSAAGLVKLPGSWRTGRP